MVREMFTKSDLKVFAGVALWLVAIPIVVTLAESTGTITTGQSGAYTFGAVIAAGVFVATRELYRRENDAVQSE